MKNLSTSEALYRLHCQIIIIITAVSENLGEN